MHQMDALFGVVNIPNIVWIDEAGTIVRPAEPCCSPGDTYPDWLRAFVDERAAATEAKAVEVEATNPELAAKLRGGQDRDNYADAIRDWAEHGTESRFAMTPDQVVAGSQDRPKDKSAGAAHFEIANHLWSAGERDRATRTLSRSAPARNPRTGPINARRGPSSETKPLVAARWVGSTRVRFLAKKTIGRSKATSPPKPVPQPQPTTTRRHSTSEACDSLGSSGMGDALRIGGRLIDDRCRIHALRQCRAEVRSTRSAA